MPIIFEKVYTIQKAKENPNTIYVFEDNLAGWGKNGQSIIRGMSNAYGIQTRKSPYDCFSDEEFEKVKCLIDLRIKGIEDMLKSGRVVVFPEDGIGTGKDDIQWKAPKVFRYLNNKLIKLVDDYR